MIEPTDLSALALPGHPSAAPDGRRVVVSVETIDPDELSYRHRLWMVTPGSPAEPITETGDWSDTAPTFSPNGELIAYLSTRDGRRAVRLVDPASGKVTVLDGPDAPVSAVEWLDDAQLVALVERPAADEAAKTSRRPPVRVSWLQYKSDGRAEFVEPTNELWILTCDGSAELLLAPDGRIGELTTHGSSIHYTLSARHSDQLTPPTEVRTFDTANAADTLRWRCPSSVKALATTAVSGTLLAVANAAPGQSVTPPQVWVVNSLVEGDGAEPAFRTGLECERAVAGDSRPKGGGSVIQPVDGSDEVLLLATVGLDVAVHIGVPGQDAEPRRLTPPGQSVSDFAAVRGGQLIVCLESPTAPAEVYGGSIGEALGKLSEFSTGWTTHQLTAPEIVQVGAADGETLDALLYRASGDSAPGPLLLRIHGGPHLAFGTTFDFETQLQVAAGYQVLLPNIRGSAGKGVRFRSLSVEEWGRGDYSDVNCLADWAVAADIADPQQMFLAGGSYGGYLVNWIVAHSDRFRAAVSERSVSNLLSKLGTSDNGATTNRFEIGGADLFGDDALELVKLSPLHYADQVVTPLLLVHGEADYRCPIEQSEQLFVALRRLGKEVEFLRFPGASHTFASGGRPDHRIARHQAILDWFATHGGPETPTAH